MDSILQQRKECFICHAKQRLHYHHIYFGTALRPISEKNGFTCWLCYEHHLGDFGVHGKHGRETDLFLKRQCQKKFEKNKSREEFVKLIGRNYLE